MNDPRDAAQSLLDTWLKFRLSLSCCCPALGDGVRLHDIQTLFSFVFYRRNPIVTGSNSVVPRPLVSVTDGVVRKR